MQIYIARLNIEHFRGQIALESEAKKLKILVRLLAEEETKLAFLLGGSVTPSRPMIAKASSKIGLIPP